MSAHGDNPDLHTVTLTDDGLTFVCSGDETAQCHIYPVCDCESWGLDHDHPSAPQQRCWMQDWFDNDCVSPASDSITEANYHAGMSGAVTCEFELDYIDWRFAEAGAA